MIHGFLDAQMELLRLGLQQNLNIYKPSSQNLLALYQQLCWPYCVLRMMVLVNGEEDQGGHDWFEPPYYRGLVDVKEGWSIGDYGYYLTTSPGNHYGSYGLARLLTTVSTMVALAAQRGATVIRIEGSLAARRRAWESCQAYNIDVKDFSPNQQDLRRYNRIISR